jgi:hypothetical protein
MFKQYEIFFYTAAIPIKEATEDPQYDFLSTEEL